jgi:hypothetical protein
MKYTFNLMNWVYRKLQIIEKYITSLFIALKKVQAMVQRPIGSGYFRAKPFPV